MSWLSRMMRSFVPSPSMRLRTTSSRCWRPPSADYAATLLEAREDIGVLFTGVSMPGTLNGFDLARRVRDAVPAHSGAGHLRCAAVRVQWGGPAATVRAEAVPHVRGHRIIRGMTAQTVLCVCGVGMHASWYLNMVHQASPSACVRAGGAAHGDRRGLS